MGKVGTTTVSRALKRAGVPVLHMHSIHPRVHDMVRQSRDRADGHRREREADGSRPALEAAPEGTPRKTGLLRFAVRTLRKGVRAVTGPDGTHIEASLKAADLILKNDGPVKIVTMVREPIARNVSAFFENLNAFSLSHDDPTEDLVDGFKRRYPHSVPLTWFDQELKDGVAFDVFAERFDREGRVGRYTKGRFDFLIMRVDADLARQQAEVSDFIGRPVSLAVENASEAKPYAAAYQAFKKRLLLDQEYVEWMYGSKFARHFWTEDELAGLRQDWPTDALAGNI